MWSIFEVDSNVRPLVVVILNYEVAALLQIFLLLFS